jgi:hypothetical protein
VLFEFIFISLFVLGWLLCGYLPWLALSIATRGHAGLGFLPLCLFAGVVAGLAVPVLGLDDANGLWLSFLVAFVAASGLLALGHYARSARLAVKAKATVVEPEPEARTRETL